MGIKNENPLGDDLLRGARPIAKFVYGADTNCNMHQVYRLAEKGVLPVFRLGKTLCARRSTLRAFVEDQERLAVRGLSDQETV
jgi:hypothetical protein